MTEASVITRNFLAFGTATTIMLGTLLLPEGSLVPSKNYSFPSKYADTYSREDDFSNPYYQIVEVDQTLLSKVEALYTFASKLIAQSQDLPPEFSKSISDNFWDLV
jgi:hypothetical protein